METCEKISFTHAQLRSATQSSVVHTCMMPSFEFTHLILPGYVGESVTETLEKIRVETFGDIGRSQGRAVTPSY